MPRRRKSNRRSRPRRQSADVMKITMHKNLLGSLTTGIGVQSLEPINIGVGTSVADVYEFYKIVGLRYRLHPPQTAPGSHQVASYLAGVVDSASNLGTDNLAQSPHCVTLAARATVPTPWCKVPKSALSSYADWYKTVPGTTGADVEIQGNMYLAGSGTDGFLLEMKITYLFKGPIVASATPKLRAEAALLREQQRLLRILQWTPPTPAAPSILGRLPPPQ